MKFVDLFAGLGGFHVALSRLGHECVFASEIDADLQEIYLQNFGIRPMGDIRLVEAKKIPKHDILCAGFPCQPFSKAGDQEGFKNVTQGDLFNEITRILKSHHPEYVFLENVPHLAKHDGGASLEYITDGLEKIGYKVDSKIFSPHQFGIPQIRPRLFIVASLSGLEHFRWPEVEKKEATIRTILQKQPKSATKISPQVADCLKVWQKFLKLFPKNVEIPSFPIWTMEFGATYPYETETPFSIPKRRLKELKGSHGVSLKKKPNDKLFEFLPSYAREQVRKFPDWKIDFIRQNRELYKKNKKLIDPWLPLILKFPPSLQKLEWNCRGEERNIWKYIIQFRASGVRVKRPTSSPALVAMTTTQIPIIAWEKRYMTEKEAAKLQSLEALRFLPKAKTNSFRALGNAVNANLVARIGAVLIVAKNPVHTKAKKLMQRIKMIVSPAS